MALLENDGSTGNRQRTTMGPYKMRRKIVAGQKRRKRGYEGEKVERAGGR